MEFLSGYAAARAPLSAYQVEPLQPSSARSNRPTRSNSTSAGTTSSSKRRARIPGHGHGHVRTSSASTTSSTRTETPSSPHTFAWLHAAGAVSDTSSAASASAYGGDPAATATTPLLSAEREPSVLRRRDPQLHPRERMPAAGNKYYYQGYNKQLPATPRLETHSAASQQQQYFSAGSSSEPASARTPASAAADPNPFSLDRRPLQHATMFPELGGSAKAYTTGPPLYPSGRAESVSSISGATTVSTRTMLSSEPPSTAEQQLRPFVIRNGRTFISDPTLPYPLPVDLEELHRQSLRTLLLIELFGGPICCPDFAEKPPKRVLEIGCGSGFWSMECYRHYERLGKHKNISFTGLDIAPVAPGAHQPGTAPPTASGTDSDSSTTPQPSSDGSPEEMKWRFVQHDLRRTPLPFRDEEFDLVMVKDMSLATTTTLQQTLIDEYLRVLQPGGTIEMWEGDHTLRMLRPHVLEATAGGPAGGESNGGGDNSSDESSSGDEESSPTQSGAYPMTANTPLSAPLNNFLVEYNSWLAKALERLQLCPVPCTLIGPLLLQESEILTGVENRRLAVPLSEVRWEREGVGGVVTKDGKSYIETKGKRAGKEAAPAGQALDPGAVARRRTALLTVVQMIQSMEHVLREVSGKSQDEWDGWLGKMMSNLVKENGTSWGECLEVGAWWARKRKKKGKS
ncbi:hypothetical protein QBC34DRAFT_301576 [Podospora aff. communis PSN243]|uniref:Methyltransferase type 11 domain-containing protein n=1 Tax=Podospora aff. communis PSN243 TaxID=3040156 RepID=A0AAV9GHC5_9PEZI|nr:hypothetical protein QBC34DRAFT_301576 [Podospora aff. communis PSN243]